VTCSLQHKLFHRGDYCDPDYLGRIRSLGHWFLKFLGIDSHRKLMNTLTTANRPKRSSPSSSTRPKSQVSRA